MIYENDKPGVVQFYFHKEGANIDIYIVDERGALFHQHKSQVNLELMINQYSRFLDAVTRRQHLHDPAAAGEGRAAMEFYQIVKHSSGKWQAAPRPATTEPPQRYFNVQVIGTENQGAPPTYTIFCDETEFSSLEYGDALFQTVAQYVLAQRKSGLCYPIHITDVDLSPRMLGMESREQLQTVVLLNYKRHVEDKLNGALIRLVENHRAQAS